jgi:hypothetical protein
MESGRRRRGFALRIFRWGSRRGLMRAAGSRLVLAGPVRLAGLVRLAGPARLRDLAGLGLMRLGLGLVRAMRLGLAPREVRMRAAAA